jgi:hypothetical protein
MVPNFGRRDEDSNRIGLPVGVDSIRLGALALRSRPEPKPRPKPNQKSEAFVGLHCIVLYCIANCRLNCRPVEVRVVVNYNVHVEYSTWIVWYVLNVSLVVTLLHTSAAPSVGTTK